MVPFAGWEMPVQFADGVLAEHLQTRRAAGLFDVSHMGQVLLRHPAGTAAAAAAELERLVPADLVGLAEGRQRYGLLLGDTGGILDDLMVANRGDHLFLVVNASRAETDLAALRAGLGETAVVPVEGRALLALQGPAAEAALARIAPEAAAMRFMDVRVIPVLGGELWVSRSGYTGEDGYEISLPAAEAEGFARALLAMEEVAPAGLGARDSLRLEAGLPLYGADLDETTTPVEAGLAWSIGKARRSGERAGGFPGAEKVLYQVEHGAPRARIGVCPEGRAPMRPGTPLFAAEHAELPVGEVTSGGYGPSLEAPISMAYVAALHAAPGTPLWGEVRGRRLSARATSLPFRPSTFKRRGPT